MDNGPVFLAALQWLEKHYGIKHIRISRYNSGANRVVECTHYNVWEAVFKACNGDDAHTYSILGQNALQSETYGLFTIFRCPQNTSTTSTQYCRVQLSLASASKFPYVYGTHNPSSHFTPKVSGTISKVT